MYRRISVGWFAAAMVGVTLATGAADRPASQPGSELDAMRRELDSLKQGQEAIGKDVAEILKILTALRPPPPVREIDGVVDIGAAPYKGKADARLTLIEFSDYQCPFCKRHVDMTLPQLTKEYVDTGKLRYVFRDFPLESIHENAFKAAEAAHCAGEQQKYWEMHDRLFAHPDALAAKDLREHAKAIGLDSGAFRKCLDSGRHAGAIRTSIAEGEKLGITGTPAVLIGFSDGKQIRNVKLMAGALPFSFFKEEIEKMLSPSAPPKLPPPPPAATPR
jgi:protein-disulfide isomerase